MDGPKFENDKILYHLKRVGGYQFLTSIESEPRHDARLNQRC